jgi:hypothetical protein
LSSLILSVAAGVLVLIQVWMLILLLSLASRLEGIREESQEQVSQANRQVATLLAQVQRENGEARQELFQQAIKSHELLLRLFDQKEGVGRSSINTQLVSEVMDRVKRGQDRVQIAQETGVQPGEIELIRGLSQLLEKT